MSLRARLFLMFAALTGLLLLAQGWWMRSLHADLSRELGSVAFSVANATAAIFVDQDELLVRRKGEKIAETTTRATEGRKITAAKTHSGKLKAEPQTEQGNGDPDHKTLSYTFLISSKTIAPRGGKPTLEHGQIIHRERRVLVHDGPVDEGEILFFSLDKPDDPHRIPVPRAAFERRLEQYSQRLMLGSLAIFGVGLLLAALLAHRITQPLKQLAMAASQVGEGKLGTQISIEARGEVGQTIQAFNTMSSQIHALDAKARRLSARQHLGEIGEIARGLAHTLRNPLNALGLSVEELASQASGAGEALADSARRQIRRIDASIRSFLTLASGGGGMVSQVNVATLAEDVALEALQDSRGRASIDIRAAPGLPTIDAVEAELRAVLQALLVNAVEASPEGGEVIASLRFDPASKEIRIEIDDRGPGLSKSIRQRLFTPHLSTKATGSGMGLFLAHRITTHRYGGALDLHDRPGGGTRAVLCLRQRDTGGEHG